MRIALSSETSRRRNQRCFCPMQTGCWSPAQELPRNVVAEPPGCRSQHLDRLRREPELLVQLAKHRIFGRFTVVDAALGKLPGIPAPNPPRPHDLTPLVGHDHANARPVAVWIDHGSRLSGGSRLFHDQPPAAIGRRRRPRHPARCRRHGPPAKFSRSAPPRWPAPEPPRPRPLRQCGRSEARPAPRASGRSPRGDGSALHTPRDGCARSPPGRRRAE